MGPRTRPFAVSNGTVIAQSDTGSRIVVDERRAGEGIELDLQTATRGESHLQQADDLGIVLYDEYTFVHGVKLGSNVHKCITNAYAFPCIAGRPPEARVSLLPAGRGGTASWNTPRRRRCMRR